MIPFYRASINILDNPFAESQTMMETYQNKSGTSTTLIRLRLFENDNSNMLLIFLKSLLETIIQIFVMFPKVHYAVLTPFFRLTRNEQQAASLSALAEQSPSVEIPAATISASIQDNIYTHRENSGEPDCCLFLKIRYLAEIRINEM